MERVNGIEPSSPGWKPGVIAIIRHPHKRTCAYSTDESGCCQSKATNSIYEQRGKIYFTNIAFIASRSSMRAAPM